MAFAPSEARRGALIAVLTFTVLVATLLGGATAMDGGSPVLVILVSLCAFFVAGVTALAAALALLPVIFHIGRSLRRVRSLWVHAGVILLFGGAAGGVIGGGLYALPFVFSGIAIEANSILVVAGLLAAFTAASTAVGWGVTVCRALRDDRA